MEITVPLTVGVRSAMYVVDPASPGAWWEWMAAGLPPSTYPPSRVRTVGDWRLTLVADPTNDAWLYDVPPDSLDGFTDTQPDFRVPFARYDTGWTSNRGLGGAVAYSSGGLAAPHTIRSDATRPRLRLSYKRYAEDPTLAWYSYMFADDTVIIGAEGGLSGTTEIISFDDDGTFVTHVLDFYRPEDEGPVAEGGFAGNFWTFRANDTINESLWRMRIRDVQMWLVYDVPAGIWPLRQRQTLTAAPSWPLRQRQNGGASGSWPLRQRQTGV